MRNPFVMECGNYKTAYSKDMALFSVPRMKIQILVLVLFFLLLPLFASSYVVGLLTLCAIASIGAIGLNILTGYTGQISIGVGAFLGVGGYTSAILTSTLGLSFWLALPLAGIATAIVGGLFGIPSLRLKGLYLAIATLAAQVIILFVISRWDSLTGGTAGMVLSRPSVGGFSFSSTMSYYYLCIVILILTAMYALNLVRTRTGRAFLAVRDRDVAAEIMGINLFKYKVMSFAISSFFVGIAGALLAHYTMIVSPELYSTHVSIEYLAMILVGGLGSVLGSILGAMFITLLPVALNYLINFLTVYMPDLYQLFSALSEFVFGGVIILFLIFEPGGLAHIWTNIKNYFRLWPFSH
ncbi:branched-chain amino acid ABC transporter permease [Pueribacillus theae]|uniref:Branched-chain amino acid ABC transporter permease n=1 Tax=Pueribacillus theae TaxID=2171751 RepID=A0A2U1K184_9BACI|nr:branched-chain amino acid ABC transporter permease [Pueribacillus theae]PWA11172.1 branched-chain amino acid ABC transporter permease [Pueribacillus theae]